MVTKLKRRTLPMPEIIKKSNTRSLYLKACCVFCERDLERTLTGWAHHILNEHTGELAYKCSKCKKMSTSSKHCGEKAEKMYPDFNKNDLKLFFCGTCDLVRVNEKNMKEHVKNEHHGNSNHTSHILFLARCRFHLYNRRNDQNHIVEQQDLDPEEINSSPAVNGRHTDTEHSIQNRGQMNQSASDHVDADAPVSVPNSANPGK